MECAKQKFTWQTIVLLCDDAVVFHLTLFGDGFGLTEGADLMVEGRHAELGLV